MPLQRALFRRHLGSPPRLVEGNLNGSMPSCLTRCTSYPLTEQAWAVACDRGAARCVVQQGRNDVRWRLQDW